MTDSSDKVDKRLENRISARRTKETWLDDTTVVQLIPGFILRRSRTQTGGNIKVVYLAWELPDETCCLGEVDKK